MNRNHPYFAKQIPAPIPKQEDFDELPFEVPSATEPYPAPVYNPEIAPLHRPMWMNNEYGIPVLGSLFQNHCYDKNKGYHIDNEGLIYDPTTSKDARTGIISAMAVGIDSKNPNGNNNVICANTHIINTEDAGLRYVHYNSAGEVVDVGPVEHVCIIGNTNRPEGIYIPMCNTKAMADGSMFLEEMIAIATKNDEDLPPFEEDILQPVVEDLSNGVSNVCNDDHHSKHHIHKCKCGGKCKCHK